jgi:hypothetical protein
MWGNEEADIFTRDGAYRNPVGRSVVYPLLRANRLSGVLVTRAPNWVDSQLWLPPVQDAVRALPSRASELLALNRLRFKVAVWLLTGHTTQRAHVESRFMEQQDCYVGTLTLCRSNLNPYCLGRNAAFFSVGI